MCPLLKKQSIWIAILLFACAPALETTPLADASEALTPPTARIIPQQFETHGDVRIDNYYWLRDRENPEMIAYLEAENAYTEAAMAHTEALQETLFNEIVGRIVQDDSSVPYRKGDYYYYTRYEESKEYTIYCRKRESLESPEEIMLDVNVLAEGHGFYAVSNVRVSSGQDLLAFSADTAGRRIYTIHFKNLSTGEIYEEMIPGVTGQTAWANDNKTLFYTKQDPVTLRWYQVYRHELGTNPAEDQLVYQEDDDTFFSYVWKTKSEQFIMIASYQTLSSEYRYIDANRPLDEFVILQERQRDHEYDVDHLGDKFYIRTNHEAQNFRLMETPIITPGMANWKEVIPHREDVLLENFELFKDHLVLQERKEGLVNLRIINWDDSGEHYLDFGEPAYLASFGTNPTQDTQILRYAYTSLTTPNSIYDYDMVTRGKTLMKQDEVLGGFDPGDYQTERLYATARDGVKVPISIVYQKGIKKDGTNPLLLYGYGAYGNSRNATFSSPRLSLLDRGFVYAIAHIRGGQEMGRWWYEDGKLLNKKNTFTDFIDCAEYLVDEGYTSPERLFGQGGSAGGLLVGAVMNMRPDLFEGIVAQVPWVDVITDMLDESIPLTTNEYDEWGNPNDKEYYDYMLSYSPYEQATTQDYPNLLVTTSLEDSQVQYWGPARWVARLRALKTNDNLIILKTEMEAGHGGVSGRYQQYHEIAFYYAFLLDLAGI